MIMTKMTITERVNAIAYETLSVEEFEFLKERALKSVHKATEKKGPTKAQKANAELGAKVEAFIAEKGVVTCADVEEAFGLNNQKASAILNRYVNAVKTEAKGKQKATWAIAE